MSFDTVVINTLLMLALGVPGFILAKIKMLDSNAIKPLSNILLYVCVPFMILKSFLTIEYQPQLLTNILLALLFSFARSNIAFAYCKPVELIITSHLVYLMLHHTYFSMTHYQSLRHYHQADLRKAQSLQCLYQRIY